MFVCATNDNLINLILDSLKNNQLFHIGEMPCPHTKRCFQVKIIDKYYCKFHNKQDILNEIINNKIIVCNPKTGCYNFPEKDKKKCESCLEKNRKNDNEQYNNAKRINNELIKNNTNSRICLQCKQEYEKNYTSKNNESTLCVDCRVKQQKYDNIRKERVRNYKEEHLRNIENYYNDVMRRANDRYITFTLTKDQFNTIINGSCYYCGYKKENEANGIDRINNMKGYIYPNCVSCCHICNRMKYTYNVCFFLEHITNIINKDKLDNDYWKKFYSKWQIYERKKSTTYNIYKNCAIKRGYNFDISENTFNELINTKCTYCGYLSEYCNGIDRKNNDEGYTDENSMPCCGPCNFMKHTLTYDKFIIHANNIYSYINKYELLEKVESYALCEDKYIKYSSTIERENDIIINKLYPINQLISILMYESWDTIYEWLQIIKYDKYIFPIKKIQDELITSSKKHIINDIGYRLSDIFDLPYEPIKKDVNIIRKIDNIHKQEFKSLESYIKIDKKVTPSEKNICNTFETINPELIKALPKQWKTNDIYSYIINGKEEAYKRFCEENNTIDDTWTDKWAEFIISVKSASKDEACKIIKEFVEDLRRIRHNALCYNKNSKLVDSEDREQWPSGTVLRAYKDGKIDKFKEHLQKQADDTRTPQWLTRWDKFVEILDGCTDDIAKNKISKFMTAERTRRYRASK